MTRELICRFVKQVYSSHMVKPRVAVCVPAAITGIESDAWWRLWWQPVPVRCT